MRNSIIWIAVLVILLISGGLYFYSQNNGENGTTFEYIGSNSQGVEDTGAESPSVLEPLPKNNPSETEPLIEEKITVSGAYSYSEDSNSKLAGKICFTPASDSKLSLFCFSNKDEAYALFNIEKGFSDGSTKCTVEGSAVIEIKNYQKLTGEVGGYDSAIVTRVISTGGQKFLPC
ncbi:MAG: hypothetical protein A2741_00505 [Candidatus Zambryskibacteria bacterium RIFCSPHIGHO2_01_FULL_43_27]|uniref:Uncharacterized protein n=1 Tax=Candidatus Zambryskibacteria bacterium RIFCSPLOWO2_01_FULL_43_17 TaxID=1802760 RepID=A0A1G2U5G7_9BACT|nr:MAG: hypothetical protein A2741_00505 [Candidatus Zambryskibacteria bacterium RIFCSPHIGHO2_01_FULL_43_27]OHA99668.1 MAG: hypothetical protein A3E93_01910 [Candidatus Zambryskibacteria bacterium RIFCSPHIGHO2_12_FULL_43_12b]OHB04728.1 MAG: hypothetical protein A2920_00550 [Candidatus Zambryskibacteria bacterium RIFCSPLOWO2_01_FULL_43_17]